MSQPTVRYRYAVDYRLGGDLRYLAHSDMVRLLCRASVRSSLPVSFTQGYNPHVRLSLPFPKPVGQTSDAERLLIDLHEDIPSGQVLEILQLQTPAELRPFSAEHLARNDSSRPIWARYLIRVSTDDMEELTTQASTLLESDHVPITRVRHKDGRSSVVNIRPFIDTLNVSRAGLGVSTNITSSSSASPSEVWAALGMKADGINHLVHRVETRWQKSQPAQPMSP